MTAPSLPIFRKVLTFIVAFGLTLALFGANTPVNAQDKLSLSISPVLFNLTANPGDTVTNTAKITNVTTDKPQAIVMEIEPFTGTETGDAVVSDSGDPAYSLKDWVKFSPSSFTIPPGQAQTVSYTIKIPTSAEPGGRYGSILASTPETKLNNGTGVSTVQKIGSLVLLQVAGPVNYQANVKSFAPTKNLFERSPITFTMRLHNDSTVHIQPKGFITIADMFGRKVTDVVVPAKIILPKEDRVVDVVWPGPASIGRYTATLLLVYGDKNAQITATQTFSVFPWKTGIPLIVLGLALIWFIITKRRNIAAAFQVLFAHK